MSGQKVNNSIIIIIIIIIIAIIIIIVIIIIINVIVIVDIIIIAGQYVRTKSEPPTSSLKGLEVSGLSCQTINAEKDNAREKDNDKYDKYKKCGVWRCVAKAVKLAAAHFLSNERIQRWSSK